MPKRKDLKKILVVGAGPIIIGQACEFDYSGTQACKALKDEGYKVILINSNPATIMTDPDIADKTYIEPITTEIVEKIIIKERPCAILPTMGGQTALNTAIVMEKKGILKKYKVELIGAKAKAISKAEDRDLFRKSMKEINLYLPNSEIVNSVSDTLRIILLTEPASRHKAPPSEETTEDSCVGPVTIAISGITLFISQSNEVALNWSEVIISGELKNKLAASVSVKFGYVLELKLKLVIS